MKLSFGTASLLQVKSKSKSSAVVVAVAAAAVFPIDHTLPLRLTCGGKCVESCSQSSDSKVQSVFMKSQPIALGELGNVASESGALNLMHCCWDKK